MVGVIGVIDMELLSVIRRWHHRDHIPIREIGRRTGLSRNTIRKYRFCQHSRQTWCDELAEKFRLRCSEDGERSGGTTEMKQAAAVGGNMLVVAGLEAKEVAGFVIASAESLR